MKRVIKVSHNFKALVKSRKRGEFDSERRPVGFGTAPDFGVIDRSGERLNAARLALSTRPCRVDIS
jgi:hypothetical protein